MRLRCPAFSLRHSWKLQSLRICGCCDAEKSASNFPVMEPGRPKNRPSVTETLMLMSFFTDQRMHSMALAFAFPFASAFLSCSRSTARSCSLRCDEMHLTASQIQLACIVLPAAASGATTSLPVLLVGEAHHTETLTLTGILPMVSKGHRRSHSIRFLLLHLSGTLAYSKHLPCQCRSHLAYVCKSSGLNNQAK